MTERGIIARMIDAALPYVASRRLHTHGLDEAAGRALEAWASEGADSATHAVLGELPKLNAAPGDLLLWLLPGVKEAPEPEGFEVIEVQRAFRIPHGLADDTAAPTLPPDPAWQYPRETDGVWMDEAEPNETLGVLVIAARGPN